MVTTTLLLSSGCAKSDWIDRTLVTCDGELAREDGWTGMGILRGYVPGFGSTRINRQGHHDPARHGTGACTGTHRGDSGRGCSPVQESPWNLRGGADGQWRRDGRNGLDAGGSSHSLPPARRTVGVDGDAASMTSTMGTARLLLFATAVAVGAGCASGSSKRHTPRTTSANRRRNTQTRRLSARLLQTGIRPVLSLCASPIPWTRAGRRGSDGIAIRPNPYSRRTRTAPHSRGDTGR